MGTTLQWIVLCVSDSQIQVVLLDGGIGRQNAIARNSRLNGCRQVVGWDASSLGDWQAAQNSGSETIVSPRFAFVSSLVVIDTFRSPNDLFDVS